MEIGGIQQLIEADKEWLLALNGSHSLFWDGFMWIVSDTKTWIPAGIALLYLILKNAKPAQGLVILLMLALAITFADQFSSGLCKPFFMRFRPSQDPDLMGLVHIVNGYRGGRYGFISSHAANTFAVATFISLLIRNKGLTIVLFAWAIIPSYSRIYLGVHFPGDILCGAVSGCIIACMLYWAYTFVQKKYFTQARHISTQYTSSGYEITDLHILYAVMLATCFYIFVAAMLVSRGLHF